MADIANGGRQEIYLLGWDGMQYFKENGNEPTGDAIGFPGDLIKDNLLTVENDHGCFFLPIKSPPHQVYKRQRPLQDKLDHPQGLCSRLS